MESICWEQDVTLLIYSMFLDKTNRAFDCNLTVTVNSKPFSVFCRLLISAANCFFLLQLQKTKDFFGNLLSGQYFVNVALTKYHLKHFQTVTSQVIGKLRLWN